jgi:hypothetical protein
MKIEWFAIAVVFLILLAGIYLVNLFNVLLVMK